MSKLTEIMKQIPLDEMIDRCDLSVVIKQIPLDEMIGDVDLSELDDSVDNINISH